MSEWDDTPFEGLPADESMAAAAVKVRPERATRPSTDRPVPWNVVLLDDDDHSYEYVIAMMQKVFGHPIEKGFQIAERVDADGRAVCLTTHKEHAELKCEQVLGFGADPFIKNSAGSMSCVIEPAEFGGDDGGDADRDAGGEGPENAPRSADD
ncbi:MAG: ATP-dependent Clp protease adaptor ClpS [Planctomycetota bacterium]